MPVPSCKNANGSVPFADQNGRATCKWAENSRLAPEVGHICEAGWHPENVQFHSQPVGPDLVEAVRTFQNRGASAQSVVDQSRMSNYVGTSRQGTTNCAGVPTVGAARILK